MFRKRAFTLIEILIVIAIIGILSVLVIFQIGQARVHARDTQAKNDILQGGQGVEAFKVANDNQVLIVQYPQEVGAPDQTYPVFCYQPVVAVTCYSVNAISPAVAVGSYSFPASNSGFTDFLYHGNQSSSVLYPTLITKAPANNYLYAYITEDCSFDIPTTAHKYSNFQTYLVASTLGPDSSGGSVDNIWVRDGQYGEGSDAAVPLLPSWNLATLAPGVVTNACKSNYP